MDFHPRRAAGGLLHASPAARGIGFYPTRIALVHLDVGGGGRRHQPRRTGASSRMAAPCIFRPTVTPGRLLWPKPISNVQAVSRLSFLAAACRCSPRSATPSSIRWRSVVRQSGARGSGDHRQRCAGAEAGRATAKPAPRSNPAPAASPPPCRRRAPPRNSPGPVLADQLRRCPCCPARGLCSPRRLNTRRHQRRHAAGAARCRRRRCGCRLPLPPIFRETSIVVNRLRASRRSCTPAASRPAKLSTIPGCARRSLHPTCRPR